MDLFLSHRLLNTIALTTLGTAKNVLRILSEQKRMSNELQDLRSAVAALAAAVGATTAQLTDETSKILAAVSKPEGIDPAEVESAAGTINQLAGNLNAAVEAA